jgi:hypothetical protein
MNAAVRIVITREAPTSLYHCRVRSGYYPKNGVK